MKSNASIDDDDDGSEGSDDDGSSSDNANDNDFKNTTINLESLILELLKVFERNAKYNISFI